MKRLLPIWFDRRNGVLIPHEKGLFVPNDMDMEIMQMTGIRLWDDRWKGTTAIEALEEYAPGLWH